MGAEKNDEPVKRLNGLSNRLKEDILNSIYIKALQNIKIFSKTFSEGFLNALCSHIKEKVYGSEEFIVYQIQDHKKSLLKHYKPYIYYISKGSVQLSLER